MAVFVYTGRTRGGQTITGEMEGANREAVVARLRSQQVIATAVRTKPKNITIPGLGGKVSDRDIVIFTRQFANSAAYPGPSNLLHPSGGSAKLGFTRASVYNTYLRTGDLSGTSDTSFLSLVPFEEGSRDYTALRTRARSDDSNLAGPDSTNAQVMCLSCHRAHASAWDGMLRWNGKTDYIVYSGLYSQEGQPYQPYGQGRTEQEAQKAYYDRPASRFSVNQDTLCNKCHNGVYP